MQLLLQGYGYSGVSFLRDFFKEVDDSFVFNEEFDLLRKSGGILDLYNVLVQNNPFLDDCVIRVFMNFYKYLAYERKWSDVLGNAFVDLSESLVNDLVLYKKEWENKGFQVQNAIKFPEDIYGFHKKYKSKIIEQNEDKNIYFLKNFDRGGVRVLLEKYMQKLLKLFPSRKYLCLVHPLQISSPLDNQLNFFDKDAKILTISRDPRDVFLDSNLIKDVNIFIEYFKKWHLMDEYNYKKFGKNILQIQFEDFVLNYGKVEKEILDFCGIKKEEHSQRKKYSNPDISKKNVGLYKCYKNQKEISLIERELKNYIYG